jgi:tetratricopeptide (TPR) repeat protein
MSDGSDEAQRLLNEGHYDKALEVSEALLAEKPEDATVLFGHFSVLMKMKRYPEAISTCERLAEAWRRRRFYHYAVIFYAHAYAHLLKYVPHLKDRFDHLPLRLAETFREVPANHGQSIQDSLATRGNRDGSDRELVELLRRVIVVDQDNPLPHRCLVDALVRVGDKKAAEKQREVLAKLLAEQRR